MNTKNLSDHFERHSLIQLHCKAIQKDVYKPVTDTFCVPSVNFGRNGFIKSTPGHRQAHRRLQPAAHGHAPRKSL
jgi:hypothetical protein